MQAVQTPLVSLPLTIATIVTIVAIAIIVTIATTVANFTAAFGPLNLPRRINWNHYGTSPEKSKLNSTFRQVIHGYWTRCQIQASPLEKKAKGTHPVFHILVRGSFTLHLQ